MQSKEVTAAVWEAAKNQWVLETGGAAPQKATPEPGKPSTLGADRVWCAMGCQRGISSNPLLSQLQVRPSGRHLAQTIASLQFQAARGTNTLGTESSRSRP